ncbi:MAG: hypothetical protein AAGH79_09345 [Bacteroidota bacterium]
MKARLFTFFLLFSISTSYAQVGISGSYLSGDFTDLDAQLRSTFELGPLNGQELWQNGYKIGIDYWFRLKPVRIEFLPELGFSTFQSDLYEPIASSPLSSRFSSFHFQTNINFYPLDFVGDCDCPTFSKSEPIFQRGFFVQISPGVQYQSIIFDPAGNARFSYDAFNYSLAGGIGLDIGISDFITVTPYAKYWYFFDVDYQLVNDFRPFEIGPEQQFVNGTANQIEAGLRLGLRFDQ